MPFDRATMSPLFTAVAALGKFAEGLQRIQVPTAPGNGYGSTGDRLDAMEQFAQDSAAAWSQIRDLELPLQDIDVESMEAAMIELDFELERTRTVEVVGADDVQVDPHLRIVLPTPPEPDSDAIQDSVGDGVPDSGGSFTETYYGDGTAESPALDYTLSGCENAHLMIGIELRDIATGPAPGYLLPRMSGGMYQVAWGNTISTWAGDSSQWFSLMYCYVDYTGGTTHGIEALGGIDIQARVTAGDVLEFRVDNIGVTQAFVIRGAIWRKAAPAAPGNVFGADAPP